jgi:hypothetical protein
VQRDLLEIKLDAHVNGAHDVLQLEETVERDEEEGMWITWGTISEEEAVWCAGDGGAGEATGAYTGPPSSCLCTPPPSALIIIIMILLITMMMLMMLMIMMIMMILPTT